MPEFASPFMSRTLRYAGRRVIDAVSQVQTNSGVDASELFFQDAQFGCLRARHDAIDAATAKIASNLEIAVKKLGHDVVLWCFPAYVDLLRDLSAVRDLIVVSRENRNDRAAIYAVISAGNFRSLVKSHETMMYAEPVMRRMALKARRNQAFAVGSIIVGTVLTIASLIFTAYVWFNPTPPRFLTGRDKPAAVIPLIPQGPSNVVPLPPAPGIR